MSNLEEKIKNLSTQFIEQNATVCFLLLLNNALQKEQEIHYEIHEDILALQNKITQYIFRLESILEDKKEVQLDALDDCIQLKKELLLIYETIYQYISLCNLYSIKVNDEYGLREIRKHNYTDNIDWESFQADCAGFLEEAEDEIQEKNRMADFMKCLPFQMARAKYYDILQNNMKYIFEYEPEQVVEHSLNLFSYALIPEKNKNFGKYFPEIANWLLSRRDFLPKEQSDDQLEQDLDDFDTILEELSTIQDMLSDMFNDINSLITLFYLGYSFEELTQENVAYADYYHTICEMPELPEIEKEVYFERLQTALEEEIETSIDKLQSLHIKQLKELKKVKDFSVLSDDTHKILYTEDFIKECYFSTLEEGLIKPGIQKDLPEASEEWKKEKFDNFLAEIKEYFSTLSVPDRKISMQVMLGLLPFTFTEDELLSMLETALDQAVFEQKFLIMNKVAMTMDSYGYGQEKHEHEHHHHEHHHHEHCDCEHHTLS